MIDSSKYSAYLPSLLHPGYLSAGEICGNDWPGGGGVGAGGDGKGAGGGGIKILCHFQKSEGYPYPDHSLCAHVKIFGPHFDAYTKNTSLLEESSEFGGHI